MSVSRQARWWQVLGLLAALALLCALPFVLSNYRTFQFTLALVYAIVLLGLNILTGYNGQISLGHGAFYAIGAYTAAILMDKFGVPYWATVPLGGAVCLVFGFLFGLPALRLHGHYLALATFALAVAMPQMLKYKGIEHWTGGVQGIVILKPDPPAGMPLNQDQWLYLLTLAVAVVMFVLAWNLIHSRVGRAWMALRDHPIAAEAMGVNSALYKASAFGISALYTGVAGALGAIVVQFVAPDSFTGVLSINFLIGVVIFIILAVMANTMAMTARERLAEYATLKALGFGPGYVARLVFGESIAIAVIGAALGIAATFPVSAAFGAKMGTLFPVFEVSGETVALQIGCALVVGVAAALLPGRRAARVNIVEGLRAIG